MFLKQLAKHWLPALIFAGVGSTLAQAPKISYSNPQEYIINATIAPLAPKNIGGSVPQALYGNVVTVAGNRIFGATDGQGNGAKFGNPYGVTVGRDGNIYVIEPGNYLLRKVTPGGVVTTFVGGGPGTNSTNGILPQDGQGSQASFAGPFGICADAAGNLYVADPGGNGRTGVNLIRKVTPGGYMTTIAGGTDGYRDGNGANAEFRGPFDVAADAAGNISITDFGNNRIRKLDPAGNVSTFAGSGITASVDGTGTSASFFGPNGIATDAAGNLFVTDNVTSLIRKITPAGVVTTFAGNGTMGNQDGLGTAASFDQPVGLTFDKAGNLYVGDYGNNSIRKITPAGVVTTLAGSIGSGFNDGVGRLATFFNPAGVAADGLGNIYVADYRNNLLRKITLTGYTINKPLPNGLNFDDETGVISGKPAVLSPATVYTITAYNGDGESSFDLIISIVNPVVVVTPVTILTYLPNTFTPNGDGINDVWNIGDLAKLPIVTVSIYNRYGNRIYYTVGYSRPWDGTYGNQALPAGTYYYIIDPKNGSAKLSGWVSLIR